MTKSKEKIRSIDFWYRVVVIVGLVAMLPLAVTEVVFGRSNVISQVLAAYTLIFSYAFFLRRSRTTKL